jgi:Concanavalin A-like lectin/glucanases superfamily
MLTDQAAATAEYRMEFLSDCYLMPAAPGDPEYEDSGVKLKYYSTQALAYYYGKCVYLILAGMANGKSITTEFRNIPSEPMGTVYLEAAGTVGRFRANGTTYAFDSDGLVVGCDAMLDGGAGLVADASGTDWFPMMVPAANLATVTPTTNATPALANTITAPAGFDPMNPGNIWASFPTDGVSADVYAVELDKAHAVADATEQVSRESFSKSLSWLLESPYNITPVSVSLVSVAHSIGSISRVNVLVGLFAGSGSGSIANQSGGTLPLLAGSGSGAVAARRVSAVAGSGSGSNAMFTIPTLVSFDFEGANNSTTFNTTGTESLSVTPYGGAKITTARKVSGQSSGSFPTGSGLEISTSGAGFNFGSGPFAIQADVYIDSMPSDWFIVSSKSSGGLFIGYALAAYTGNGIGIGYGRKGVAWDYISSQQITMGQWCNIKIVCDGTTIKLFLDNSQIGSTQTRTASYNLSAGGGFYVADHNDGGSALFMNGNLDNLDIWVP